MSGVSKSKAMALERATKQRAEAEGCLGRMSLFGFGKTQKHADAAEKYKDAGNSYKMGEDFRSAAAMYELASDNFKVGESDTDTVSMMVEAATCYEKTDKVKCVEAYQKAIEFYNIQGRWQRSSQYLKKVAEVYEGEGDIEQAMSAYEEAASMYANDGKPSQAQSCNLKIAGMATSAEMYDRAAKIYGEIGITCMDSNLGKYAAKGHFFNAALCHLAIGDVVQIQNKVEEFKNVDFSFGTSRECQFIDQLVEAVAENNSQAYAQACADFDRISPLDHQKTTILMKGKSHIMEDNDEVDLNEVGGDDSDLAEALEKVNVVNDGDEEEEDLT
jgi:alpha-soluble NSF attachment protein